LRVANIELYASTTRLKGEMDIFAQALALSGLEDLLSMEGYGKSFHEDLVTMTDDIMLIKR
jgi:hypothetical protein